MELAAGIAAACFKSDFQMALKSALKGSMKSYSSNDNDRLAWENVQSKVSSFF